MGMCLDATPEMGDFLVEVRRESFYLQNTSKRKPITLYPDVDDSDTGVVELMIEDIPKLRAALDQVEQYVNSRK